MSDVKELKEEDLEKVSGDKGYEAINENCFMLYGVTYTRGYQVVKENIIDCAEHGFTLQPYVSDTPLYNRHVEILKCPDCFRRCWHEINGDTYYTCYID